MRKNNKEHGVTLIELMFACFVLVVGMLGVLAMLLMAMQSNARARFDTTSTMLAQMIIEQINVLPTNATDPVTGAQITQIVLKDCQTATHNAQDLTINVQAGASGAPVGAALTNNNTEIDWLQTSSSVPAGYKMFYHSCGDTEFEVRWHIEQAGGGSPLTKYVVVSARQRFFNDKRLAMFAPPVTLRTISGP
jgi:Tfp pilus assembly protein PilV